MQTTLITGDVLDKYNVDGKLVYVTGILNHKINGEQAVVLGQYNVMGKKIEKSAPIMTLKQAHLELQAIVKELEEEKQKKIEFEKENIIEEQPTPKRNYKRGYKKSMSYKSSAESNALLLEMKDAGLSMKEIAYICELDLNSSIKSYLNTSMAHVDTIKKIKDGYAKFKAGLRRPLNEDKNEQLFIDGKKALLEYMAKYPSIRQHDIAKALKVHDSTVNSILRKKKAKMYRSTYDKIMKLGK